MPAQTVIKLRRDTAANWTSVDPILAAGEAGFESDSNKLKIGDGTSTWSQLSYASGGGGVAIDDTAPTDTEATPLWWDTASGTLYIYYDNYWVEAVVGVVGPQGPAGVDGVAAATLPLTYDPGTSTVGLDESAIEIAPSQVSGTAIVEGDARLTDARTPTAHTHFLADITDYEAPVGKNYLLNGDTAVWQRSRNRFVATGEFTADRWVVAGSSVSFSRVNDSPSNVGGRCIRVNPESGLGGVGQAIELPAPGEPGVFAIGSQWTLSYYAKAPFISRTSTTIVNFVNLGRGGAVTVAAASESPMVTTSWQRFSRTFTINALPSSTNIALMVEVRIPSAGEDAFGSGGVYITGLKLEPGSKATAFSLSTSDPVLEREACLAYYQTSYNVLDSTPAGGATFDGAIITDNSGGSSRLHVPFAPKMRASPSVSFRNPSTGGFNSIRNISANTNIATVAAFQIGQQGFGFNSSVLPSGNNGAFHFVAEAEI
jgi:hypothetical protein